MRYAKTFLLLILGMVLLSIAAPAFALSNEFFTLNGTVSDANWNPVPGANVTLYDNKFNDIANTVTNVNGNFLFQDENVTTYTCTVRVQLMEGGTLYKIPDYYFLWYRAVGNLSVSPAETHFEDYYVYGSKPMACPTPMPTAMPTFTPIPTVVPTAGNDTTVPDILLFVGGFAAGAVIATLACFFLMHSSRKP
jgi:hypothetical protein